MTIFDSEYRIDHFDMMSGRPRSSRKLQKQRWPQKMQVVVSWFEMRLEKRRTRRALSRLSDFHLKDISVTPEQMRSEVKKGFLE